MTIKRGRPAVSVVIPAFNRRRWLGETLSSVRAQTFVDHEVILVDDGSTDGTAHWVENAFPEVRVLRLPRNHGPAAARNRGIAETRGPLIAFLDSDDLWRADHLRALAPQFRDPRVVVAFSNYARIDGKGLVTHRRALKPGPSGLWIAPLTSAAIVRRSALAAAGGFDAGFQRLYDEADLFVRLLLRHGPAGFRLVDRALVCHRTHGRQLAPKSRIDPRALLDRAYLVHKHRAWLAPMLASPDRRPPPAYDHIGYGYSVFEFAMFNLLKNRVSPAILDRRRDANLRR